MVHEAQWSPSDTVMNQHRVSAPLSGTVVAVADVGTLVRAGRAIVIIESMKMQHDVMCDFDVVVESTHVLPGDTVHEGALLAVGSIASSAPADTRNKTKFRPSNAPIFARYSIVACSARMTLVRNRPRVAILSVVEPHERTFRIWSTTARSSNTAHWFWRRNAVDEASTT